MCELRDFLGIYICIPWRAKFYFWQHPKRGINSLVGVAEILPLLHFLSGKNTVTVFLGSTAGFDMCRLCRLPFSLLVVGTLVERRQS
jgi:hypothetical protein